MEAIIGGSWKFEASTESSGFKKSNSQTSLKIYELPAPQIHESTDNQRAKKAGSL